MNRKLRPLVATAVLLGLLTSLLLLLASCSSPQATTPIPGAPDSSQARAGTPQSAEAWFQLGNDQYQQNQFLQAIASYQQAIDLDGTRPEYHANLGVTHYTVGDLTKAIESYQTGLSLAPEDAELNYLLGAAFLQENRLAEAQESLLKANQLDPELAEPYYGLGVLYRLQGKQAEAIEAFERFLALGTSQDPSAVPAAQAELEALRAGQ